MKSLLILCTGNSCRSQMAEAYARHFLPSDEWQVFSAGIEKHGLNRTMLIVMEEDGIDMSTHASKTTMELEPRDWDLLITVCGHADENCPIMPAKKRLHIPFDDPPKLSQGMSNDEALPIFRRVRNEIKDTFKSFSFDEY